VGSRSLSREAALAGVLVGALVMAVVMAVDATSYGVGVLGLLLLRLPAEPVRSAVLMIRQLREGWSLFRSTTRLRGSPCSSRPSWCSGGGD
jgi:hypothetical protein